MKSVLLVTVFVTACIPLTVSGRSTRSSYMRGMTVVICMQALLKVALLILYTKDKHQVLFSALRFTWVSYFKNLKKRSGEKSDIEPELF